jgi:TnpA family transposase
MLPQLMVSASWCRYARSTLNRTRSISTGGRGVTWYNLLSDQGTGLNAVTVPGTLRDSLVLLSVVLEQQTELQPTHIMTDTGACSDVVFGLFRLLGYRFSPRLADIGGTRFWRLDAKADYGELNSLARQRVNLDRITPYWDDVLRLTGSLKLGRGPARGIMRTLQVDDQPTLDRETKTRLRDIGEARVILGDVISGVDSKETCR